MTGTIIECVQRSPEWFQARAGNATGSRIADILAKGRTKGEESASRRDYRAQLVAEILSGFPAEEGFVSKWMERGIMLEPVARAAYEVQNDVIATPVGFIQHPVIARAGCSPDALIGEDGGIEIKVPKIATHMAWMKAGMVIPKEHEPQVVWNLACTRREWWDFVSFCPELPKNLQLFVVRAEAAPDVIEGLETAVEKFLHEVEEEVAYWRGRQ